MVESNPSLLVFKSSVGPGELVYTPAAWLKIELPSEDNVMIRMTICPKHDVAKVIPDLKITAADLMPQGQKNLALEAALAILSAELKDKPAATAEQPEGAAKGAQQIENKPGEQEHGAQQTEHKAGEQAQGAQQAEHKAGEQEQGTQQAEHKADEQDQDTQQTESKPGEQEEGSKQT